MVLTSELFKNNKQLQDCSERDSAHIVANEPPVRRGVNDRGEHVALIHKALRQIMPNVSFGLEEATETYGPKTAEVVRQFKAMQNPPILNKALRQTTPDNIVGKLTIAALDEQVKRKKPTLPPVVPPVKPDATEERLVFKKTFEERFINRPARDPEGGFGDALGEVLFAASKDFPRMLRNPIEGSDFDDGIVQSKQTRPIFVSQVMKVVNIDEEVRRLPNVVKFGAFSIVLNITRIYTYSYGVGQPTHKVIVNTTRTLLKVFPGVERSVQRSTRFVSQPSSFLDPR